MFNFPVLPLAPTGNLFLSFSHARFLYGLFSESWRLHLKNGRCQITIPIKCFKRHVWLQSLHSGKYFRPLVPRASINYQPPSLKMDPTSSSPPALLSHHMLSELIVFRANHVIWAVLLRDLHFNCASSKCEHCSRRWSRWTTNTGPNHFTGAFADTTSLVNEFKSRLLRMNFNSVRLIFYLTFSTFFAALLHRFPGK